MCCYSVRAELQRVAYGAGGGGCKGDGGGCPAGAGGGGLAGTGYRFIWAMPMRPDGSIAEKVTVKGIPGSRLTCGMTTFAARTLLLYGSVNALL